jgi:hypothetical protein
MSAITLHRNHHDDLLGAAVTVEGGDAITMPAAFAALVQAELEVMMLAGLVVTDPGEGSWTFLTQPANTPAPAVPADLLALGVRLLPAGTRVALPATADRPPALWSVVIGASRRVADRARRSAA